MFSGVGGFENGIQKANKQCECVGFSEIDKYSCQVLKYRFPNIKNYGDATKINPEQLPDFDMLCGGFPCQAFSIAGKRMGFEDTRGTLFFEIARIIKTKKPRFLFLENVKGLLSHDNGRTFLTILATLDELGYNCEWEVLNSKHFGVPQNRERVFIIGHLRGTSCRQVFPIGRSSQCVDRTSEEARDEGERVWNYPANTLSQRDYKGGNQLICSGIIPESEKAKGNYLPRERVFDSEGIARAVSVNPNQMPYYNNLKERSPITLINKNQSQRVYSTEGTSITLKGLGGGQGAKTVLYAMDLYNNKLHADRTPALSNPCHNSLRILECQSAHNTLGEIGVKLNSKIRRLTPVECERLQNFPDNWTKHGINEKGEVIEISDSQRYKMMGNAVTTSVIQAIMEKLIETQEVR